MSMYENVDKDNLYYDMKEFLKEHYISELLEIVTAAIEYKEENPEA